LPIVRALEPATDVGLEQNHILLKAPVLQRRPLNKTNKAGRTNKSVTSRRMRSKLHPLPTL
jgi:hypothetical protein